MNADTEKSIEDQIEDVAPDDIAKAAGVDGGNPAPDDYQPTAEDIMKAAVEEENLERFLQDEVAVRVRNFAVNLVNMIADHDSKSGKKERDENDLVIPLIESGLDLVYIYLKDMRRIANALEKQAELLSMLHNLEVEF